MLEASERPSGSGWVVQIDLSLGTEATQGVRRRIAEYALEPADLLAEEHETEKRPQEQERSRAGSRRAQPRHAQDERYEIRERAGGLDGSIFCGPSTHPRWVALPDGEQRGAADKGNGDCRRSLRRARRRRVHLAGRATERAAASDPPFGVIDRIHPEQFPGPTKLTGENPRLDTAGSKTEFPE